MSKFSSIFRRHILAIAGAALVGIICSAPQVSSTRTLGDAYLGIPYLYQDSEWSYLSRIQDVTVGRENSGIVPYFGEYPYAFVARVLGVSPVTVVLTSKAVLPAILFLLVYLFSLSLLSVGDSDRRLTALASAFCVVLGYRLANPHYILSLLGIGSAGSPISLWTRLVNPITGAILLYGVLISQIQVFRTRRWQWSIVVGLILGFMSGYIFSLLYTAAVLAVLMLVFIFKKQWKIVCYSLISFACAGAINIRLVTGLSHSESTDVFSPLLRNGLINTRYPLENTFILLALGIIAVMVILYRRSGRSIGQQERTILTWGGALLLSGFIVLNQHIITGITIWPQHFVQYTIGTVFVGMAVASYILVRPLWPHFWRGVVVGVIILCVYAGVRDSVIVAESSGINRNFAEIQRYEPVIHWLNQHEVSDCTVLIAEPGYVLTSMIPALTGCKSYDTMYAYSLPYERVLHNYLVRMRLQGVTAQSVAGYLQEHQNEVTQLFFSDWIELFLSNRDPWLLGIADQSAIASRFMIRNDDIAAEYQDFLKKNFTKELRAFPIDYIIWDRNNLPTTKSLFVSAEPQVEIGDFTIFRFTAEGD